MIGQKVVKLTCSALDGIKLICLIIRHNILYQYLSDIIVPDWLLVGCDDDDKEHAHSVISRFYCDIVAKLAALLCAAQCSVPIAKQNFF